MDRRCWSVALAGLLMMAAAGCGRTSASAATEQASYTRHAMRGEVLGKSGTAEQLTVKQGVIRDFMPAMDAVYTMNDPATFRALAPGDQVTGTILTPADGGANLLADVTVTAKPRHPLTPSEIPAHLLLMGEAVPEIPMVNQAGQPVQFAKFRGKALLLTFVDSKCKEDCPIITARFQKVDQLLEHEEQAYAASHLLTVSIDPANDTPPVLRQYGLKYLDGSAQSFAHWSFVDLTPANLKKLATAFGVIYRPSGDGDIVHTMVTALVGPDGTMQQMWNGDDWNPQDVARAVESAAVGAKGRL
jgi:protein SCO1/2